MLTFVALAAAASVQIGAGCLDAKSTVLATEVVAETRAAGRWLGKTGKAQFAEAEARPKPGAAKDKDDLAAAVKRMSSGLHKLEQAEAIEKSLAAAPKCKPGARSATR